MTSASPVISIRLPSSQRWLTYLTLVLVATSGALWFLVHDLLQLGWMLTERRLLIAHGVTAAISLVVVGGLLPLHIRLAWRTHRNLISGFLTLLLMASLGLTGLLLYYSGEDWRDWVRWLHIGVGFMVAVAVPGHIWLGKNRGMKKAAFGQNIKSATKAGHTTHL